MSFPRPALIPAILTCGVLLDGVPVEHVVGFSETHGWVERYLTDSLGRRIRQGAGYASETLHGEVMRRRCVEIDHPVAHPWGKAS